MSDFTLYKSCLRKVVINLRKRFYKPTTKNYFEKVPSKLVNAIMSAALDSQRAIGFGAEVLQPLVISGRLQDLKIYGGNITKIPVIEEILGYLQSSCESLKTLHLQLGIREIRSRTIKDALRAILTKASDLEDLNCCFNFDLKALINCCKLRKLSLHFIPERRWCEFLEEKEGSFKTHKYLEVFNICQRHRIGRDIPYQDIEVILRNCPNLTSLGFIESSGALCRLDEEMTSEMKLRHCYWDDSADNDFHQIGEAVKRYSNIKELYFDVCRFRSVPCLQNLRNLIFLHIYLDSIVSSVYFNNALQVIGPNLKHLALRSRSPMDISLVLHNCRNLKSFKVFRSHFSKFTIPSVTLPNLKRLSIYDDKKSEVLPLFRSCDKLIELFIMRNFSLNVALSHFLDVNSPLSLKVAGFGETDLTEDGFREFLIKASNLEKIFNDNHYREIIDEMNPGVQLYDGFSVDRCEFFYKRTKLYEC